MMKKKAPPLCHSCGSKPRSAVLPRRRSRVLLDNRGFSFAQLQMLDILLRTHIFSLAVESKSMFRKIIKKSILAFYHDVRFHFGIAFDCFYSVLVVRNETKMIARCSFQCLAKKFKYHKPSFLQKYASYCLTEPGNFFTLILRYFKFPVFSLDSLLFARFDGTLCYAGLSTRYQSHRSFSVVVNFWKCTLWPKIPVHKM